MDKFDKALQNMPVPPVSDDFSARIIAAARQIPQKQSVWQVLNSIFTEFMLPAPQYSLASLVIVGFVAGFSINMQDVSADGADYSVDSVMEELLVNSEELI